MFRTTTDKGNGRWRLGAWALTAAFLTLLSQTGYAQPGRGSKMDRSLRERIEKVENGEDVDAPVKVIVTMRAGAKQKLGQKVRSHGGRHESEFSIINGGAAELSLSKLKELENDAEVENISVDADVRPDGVASSVTGAALNSGFSLRSALGLRGVSATSTTKTFQQGSSVYNGTADGGINSAAPSTSYGTSTSLKVEVSSTAKRGMLLRFDDLFGTAAGQIPPGSTITAATLRVTTVSDGSTSGATSLHRMLIPWGPTATWNSLVTSGSGLQLDDVEASATAAASVSATATGGSFTFSGAGVTASVQAWANGQPNNGWVLWHPLDDGWIVRTSEDATLANRPLLTVAYKAPVNTTTLAGNGVTVAVIDSGLLEDGGGTTRIKTTRDFTTGLTNPPHILPVDGYGHGTHIAGLIGGNKSEVEGVAPGAKFVSLRVLDTLGVGSTSSVIAAIQWAIANKSQQGIDVINLSLGHPIFEPAATDPLVRAVESAVRAGITVVVAAGNMGINPATGQVGYTGIASPANAPSAITVGSSRTMNTTTRTDDLVSDFSSRGPTWYDAFEKPDVVAPGQYLLGPATTTQVLYTTSLALRGPSYGGRAYMYLSGTSMAAGVVSGSVALMIEQTRLAFASARPTSNAIKAMLQRSAIPLSNAGGTKYDYLTQGAGSLNPVAATQLAAALNPNAAAGTNWVSNTIPSTTAIDGQVIGLNDNVVWGTNVLWGGALDTKLNAWNDNVVWGTNDNVVWGTSLAANTLFDNIVWGSAATWQDNVVWGTGDNVVWGTGDNVVWGTRTNLVCGSNDNVVWGTDDNVVWGTSALVTPQP